MSSSFLPETGRSFSASRPLSVGTVSAFLERREHESEEGERRISRRTLKVRRTDNEASV